MTEEQLQFDIFEKPRIVACGCDVVKGTTHYALNAAKGITHYALIKEENE